MVLANIADFMDGFAARALRVDGPMGKELDSLADMVSFGVVPGFIVFDLLQISCELYNIWLCQFTLLPFTGFLLTLASAFRLAKFNLDTRQSDRFIGLATPANTIFFIGIYLIIKMDRLELNEYLLHPFLLLLLIVLFSYLLLSRVELFKLKFDKIRWKGYRKQWILLVLAIPAFIFLKEAALSLLILLYIMLSLSRYVQFGK
jgi:CDP-diacylglycerol---serine O-phosphatidyltransferase